MANVHPSFSLVFDQTTLMFAPKQALQQLHYTLLPKYHCEMHDLLIQKNKKLKIYIVSVSLLPPSSNLHSLLLYKIKVKNTANTGIKLILIFAKLANLESLFIHAKLI